MVALVTAIRGSWVTDEVRSRFCFVSTGAQGTVCEEESHLCAIPQHGALILTNHNCSTDAINATAVRYTNLRQVVLSHINTTFVKRFEFMDQLALGEYRDFIEFPRPFDQAGMEMNITLLPQYLNGSTAAVRALLEIYLTIPGVNWSIYSPGSRPAPREIATRRAPLSADDGEYRYKWAIMRDMFANSVLPLEIIEYEIKPLVVDPTALVIERVEAFVLAAHLLRSTDAELDLLREAVMDALRAPVTDMQSLSWLYSVAVQQGLSTLPVQERLERNQWIRHWNEHNHRPHYLVPGFFTSLLRVAMPETDWVAAVAPTDVETMLKAVGDSGLPNKLKAIVLRVFSRIIDEQGFDLDAFELIPFETRDMVINFQPQRHHYLYAVRVSLLALVMDSTKSRIAEITALMQLASMMNLEEIELAAAESRSTLVSRDIKMAFSNPFDLLVRVRECAHYDAVWAARVYIYFAAALKAVTGTPMDVVVMQADTASAALLHDLELRKAQAQQGHCFW